MKRMSKKREREEKGLQGRVEKGEGAYAIRSCGSSSMLASHKASLHSLPFALEAMCQDLGAL